MIKHGLSMNTPDAHRQIIVRWTIHCGHLNAVEYLLSPKVSLKSYKWETKDITSYTNNKTLDTGFEGGDQKRSRKYR